MAFPEPLPDVLNVKLYQSGSAEGDDEEGEYSLKLTDKDLSALPIVKLQVSLVVLFVLRVPPTQFPPLEVFQSPDILQV